MPAQVETQGVKILNIQFHLSILLLQCQDPVATTDPGRMWLMRGVISLTLPGPSRTIIVEPVEEPARVDPRRSPDPAPSEPPDRDPGPDPKPDPAPEREPEHVPA